MVGALSLIEWFFGITGLIGLCPTSGILKKLEKKIVSETGSVSNLR
jgi:hypothetical protein